MKNREEKELVQKDCIWMFNQAKKKEKGWNHDHRNKVRNF